MTMEIELRPYYKFKKKKKLMILNFFFFKSFKKWKAKK